MTAAYLLTKIWRPRLYALTIPRPRLGEMFAFGQNHPLTLVAAPAGYGKTTAVNQWLTQTQAHPAWLSLSDEEQDPLRFWQYVIRALQEIAPHIGSNAAPLGQDANLTINSLLNDLAETRHPLLLVLDDYHLVSTPTLDEMMTHFIENLPYPHHIIITCRDLPAFPLARWRVRRLVNEISAENLRFSPVETSQFLREVMHLELSSTAVTTLEQQTEGWVAGLQMAALSVQGRSNQSRLIGSLASGNRFVVDYLLQEVLNGLPVETRSFLLETAVLDQFSAPLCTHLTGRSDAQSQLDALERANLFLIPLDDTRTWYRYHHLFADLLRQQLAKQRPAEQITALHQQAATWYAAHQLIDPALHHAFASNNLDQAAQIIEEALPSVQWGQGDGAAIQQQLRRLPAEVIERSAKLCAYAAWMDYKRVAYYLNLAERLNDPDSADYAEVVGMIAARRIGIENHKGNFEGAIACARHALSLLSPEQNFLRDAINVTLTITFTRMGDLQAAIAQAQKHPSLDNQENDLRIVLLGTRAHAMPLWALARLKEADRVLQAALQQAARRGADRSVMISMCYAELGNIHYQWNDLEAAQQYFETAIDCCGSILFDDGLRPSFLGLARLAAVAGEADLVESYLQQLAPFVEVAMEMSMGNGRLHTQIAAINLKLQKWDAVADWLHQSNMNSDAPISWHYAENYFVLFDYTKLRQPVEALTPIVKRLTQLHHNLLEQDQRFLLIRCQIKLAEAHHLLGNQPRALKFMGRALRAAADEGLSRIFLDAGEPLVPLLQRAVQRQIVPQFCQSLLKSCVDRDAHAITSAPLPEPLTEREQEILTLIAQGLSTRQIAEDLVLTAGTAKWHTNNIYKKLGVHSRVQAVTRALELGLVHPPQ